MEFEQKYTIIYSESNGLHSGQIFKIKKDPNTTTVGEPIYTTKRYQTQEEADKDAMSYYHSYLE